MSEDYEHPADVQMAHAFAGLAGTVQGMAMGLYDRHEYKMVPLDELSEHGAERWRVVPVPPAQEITQGLTGPKAGPLMFLMERMILADDAGLELLAAGDDHCHCPANQGQPHPAHTVEDIESGMFGGQF